MPSKPKGVSLNLAAQNTPWAGVPTTELGISHEPALQHKKRVEGPPSSFSINLDDGGNYRSCDDFALLGKQQKFADNVQYGLKQHKVVSKSVDRARDINTSNNAANVAMPPPPKQMKIAERQSRARQKPDVTVKAPAVSKKVTGKENITPTSPPPAPRTRDKGTNVSSEKQELKDKNLADILPQGRNKTASASKSKDSMNEGVQTNMDKGVMQAQQEATADYSLKYKAGVAPARAVRKPSEYQKEYTWKRGIPASPLISAEQIIHQSKTNLSPVKKSAVPKRTEYQTQFKMYKAPESMLLAPKPSQEPPMQRGRSKTQVKRSKSVGAGLSPDRMAPAGSAPVTSAEDPRLLRESRNTSPTPKVPIGHGKIKHKATEYRTNFKSPTHFLYDGGAWKDAYPAHLLQDKGDGDVEKAAPVEKQAAETPTWFAEVLELRRRANEYKKRAQGTHFSREHLVQLMAQQAGYWDAESARSSAVTSLDALALEPARPAGVPSFAKRSAVDKASMMAMRGDSVADDDNNGDDDGDPSAQASYRPAKRDGRRVKRVKKAWEDEVTSEADLNTNQNACDAQSSEDVEEGDDDAGRLPTPVLRERGERLRRHHLDRTTPSMGGVLLSAPHGQAYAESGDSEDTVTESQPSPKVNVNMELHTSPLLGKPTADTHALRDDSADCDQPLQVQYIASPQRSLAKADRNLKALQRRMNAKIPPTIDERMGQTYKQDMGMFEADDLPLVRSQQKDDDVLSLSARSIASSCSLASEVYQRAKQRRDNFWNSKSD